MAGRASCCCCEWDPSVLACALLPRLDVTLTHPARLSDEAAIEESWSRGVVVERTLVFVFYLTGYCDCRSPRAPIQAGLPSRMFFLGFHCAYIHCGLRRSVTAAVFDFGTLAAAPDDDDVGGSAGDDR